MSAIPLFSIPFGYFAEAYRSTCVEVPLVENSASGQRRVYRGSPEYGRLTTTVPGYNLKTELGPFCDRMGVRKDLLVIEKLNLGFCTAQGTNFFTKDGDAVIWVAPNFQSTDKYAWRWIMKHEISHIKHNDCCTIPLVAAICSTAAVIWCTFQKKTLLPTLVITMTTGSIARMIFSQYCEGKADDLAIAGSSVEELKGGVRFLKTLRSSNLDCRNTTGQTIVISSTGENRRMPQI